MMSVQPPGGGTNAEEPIPLHPEAPPQTASRIQHSQRDVIPVEGLDGPGPGSLIRTIGSSSGVAAAHDRDAVEAQLKRPMNATGTGATRCRSFTCKLTDAAISHMDTQIAQWLDGTTAEVKFSTTTVGRFEGKTPENRLIVTIWY